VQQAERLSLEQIRAFLETLLAIPQPEQFLRPGVSVAMLRRMAHAISDTEAARRMQQAKRTLFEELRRSA